MNLADVLRRCVLNDRSISAVSRDTAISQPTLQEFAVGKADGTFADLRLSSVQRLIEYYGIDRSLTVPSTRRKGIRMRLAEELKVCECNDSPEKFRERLLACLMEHFPELTIENLVCLPILALAYCNRIREGVGSESLYDAVILNSLMNIRKSKNCPTRFKSVGRRRLVSNELRAVGVQCSPAAFRELVANCLSDMYSPQTIDEIVCHPREARALCNYVRTKATSPELPDELILSTLLNARKGAEHK